MLLHSAFLFLRCGHCQRIALVFEQLARKYPRAIFLKVDVDRCQETAASHEASAMPTFILYRNKVQLMSQRNPSVNLSSNVNSEHFNIIRLNVSYFRQKSIGSKGQIPLPWRTKFSNTTVARIQKMVIVQSRVM